MHKVREKSGIPESEAPFRSSGYVPPEFLECGAQSPVKGRGAHRIKNTFVPVRGCTFDNGEFESEVC